MAKNLDNESMDQVSGGYTVGEVGKDIHMVIPTQKNEKLKFVQNGDTTNLTARKGADGLTWDVECSNGFKFGGMDSYTLVKDTYIEDEYGNKIGSDLKLL
jgi:hypothetical protein